LGGQQSKLKKIIYEKMNDTKNIKILTVLRSTRGSTYSSGYFLHVLNEIKALGTNIQVISQEEYLMIGQNDYNVLVYNSFPDETHPRKFDKGLIEKCDEKFNSFKGTKILLDTHDNGTKDGFARFDDFLFPRIKVNPSYEMIKKMNLVMMIPFVTFSVYRRPQKERPFKIVCAMRTDLPDMPNMPHLPYVRQIRQLTFQRLKRFNPDNRWLPLKEHARRLCQTLINVVANGTVYSVRTYADTLAAGALMMAEENIKNIKILPFADLEDGVDYIPYNLDNVCEKLDFLLANPELINKIRMSGLNKFITGYDYARSARQLLDWLEKNKSNLLCT